VGVQVLSYSFILLLTRNHLLCFFSILCVIKDVKVLVLKFTATNFALCLSGRSLLNSVYNLGIHNQYEEALRQLGYNLEVCVEQVGWHLARATQDTLVYVLSVPTVKYEIQDSLPLICVSLLCAFLLSKKLVQTTTALYSNVSITEEI
jgi:hypothetical protein